MRQLIVLSGITALLAVAPLCLSYAEVAQTAPLPAVAVPAATPVAEESSIFNLWGYMGQPSPEKVNFRDEYHSGVDDAKTDFIDTTTQATIDFKNNLYKGTRELRDWLLTPPEKRPLRSVPTSYCYSSYQDVLCYRQPMPGWENRLIGYQGTDAEAPPVAMTQPLPTRRANPAMEPRNRVANAQPVFVEMPAEVKPEEKKNQDDTTTPTTVDTTHEPLPDPALAPQL